MEPKILFKRSYLVNLLYHFEILTKMFYWLPDKSDQDSFEIFKFRSKKIKLEGEDLEKFELSFINSRTFKQALGKLPENLDFLKEKLRKFNKEFRPKWEKTGKNEVERLKNYLKKEFKPEFLSEIKKITKKNYKVKEIKVFLIFGIDEGRIIASPEVVGVGGPNPFTALLTALHELIHLSLYKNYDLDWEDEEIITSLIERVVCERFGIETNHWQCSCVEENREKFEKLWRKWKEKKEIIFNGDFN